MKLSVFLTSLVATILLVACVQSTAAPAATTTTGLQIMEPWARQARMTGGEAMPSDTASSSAAMSMTTNMTATDAMSSTAMNAAAPMTTTEAMSATATMSGTMGMGMGGAMGAMYMTIRNPTTTPDRLIKAESDVSQVVELHNMAMKDGVMSMYPVEAIDIPANGEAVLKPGGFHVMLIGLTRDLMAGDTMTVTLTFEQAGEITLQAPIRER